MRGNGHLRAVTLGNARSLVEPLVIKLTLYCYFQVIWILLTVNSLMFVRDLFDEFHDHL